MREKRILLILIVLLTILSAIYILTIPAGSKECNIDSDCVVFGETGDCNCGCYNKNHLPSSTGGECFCLAPTSCKCVNGKCEGVFGENCAKEEEQFSVVYDEYPGHCCEGLTEWHSGMDTKISIADECYETGLVAGSPVGTCINCGNGICEEIENPCNCPEDCIGKNRSDHLSIEEFCQSDIWNKTLSDACQEGYPEVSDLPICELC